jgi:phenylpropionate dioxygenase-like ring-hydroxylating dioxygenase large terminal subunit
MKQEKKPDFISIRTEDLDRVALPLEQAWTMPPAVYTDPAIYELEKERILSKSWIPVGRLDQVREPGDYISLTLLDQPLVLVHGHDGEIRVMSRVCLHRAAPIVEGNGNRKLFTCPYHSWAYATDGTLVRAPLMEGAEGFDEKSCALPQVRVEIWQGFILVNLDEGAKPLAPQIETYTKFFENYRAEDVVIVETLEFDTPLNWKILVENFMEAYHHIGTHATTFEPTYHAKDSRIPDNDGPWSILHMPSGNQHEGAFPNFAGLEDWQERDLIASVIFPFFMLAFQSDLVVWYQVIPDTYDRFTLKIHICAHKSALDLPDLAERCEGMKVAVGFIHGEDIEANDLVWQGLNAPLTQQGRLSPLEKSIWQMNQWWLEEMGE